MRVIYFFLGLCVLVACQQTQTSTSATVADYFSYGDSLESAGVKLIPIKTPVGGANQIVACLYLLTLVLFLP